MPHPHGWVKQSLDLLKPEARLARALVQLDSRHAVAPQICSRHGHPPAERSKPAAAGSHAAYRLPIPAGCVSYFAHSREFFELNDGVRADLGVNSRDAPRPRRSSSPRSNCCSDDGRLRFCGNFKSITRDAGTSFVGLTLWLHKRARCEARHDVYAHFCRRELGVIFGGGESREELLHHSL